jgi:hypothetical protein
VIDQNPRGFPCLSFTVGGTVPVTGTGLVTGGVNVSA